MPYCFCPEINEICLFRILNEYLNNYTYSIFAKETHGAKGFVEFIQKDGTKSIKEIADLQILCYDTVSKSVKISFLQAKFNRLNLNGNSMTSFEGDALQWDLLNYRPLIRSVGSIDFPDDILHSSRHLSIGGFGVFYYINTKQIGLVYSAASELRLKNGNYTRKRCKRVIYPLVNFSDKGNSKEALVRSSLQGYIDSLLLFEIGSPILVNSLNAKYVLNLLFNIRNLENYEGSVDLLETMINILGGNDDDTFNNEGYINTLIIKSNSEKKEIKM